MFKLRQHSFRPTVEVLESRLVPANVAGSVTNGVLSLVAKDASASDDLTVNQGAIPGSVSVVGDMGTTVNGAGNFTFKQVRSIVFNLKGGDDVIDVNLLQLSGGLTVNNGGSANGNALTLSNSRIGGTVTVINGANAAGGDQIVVNNVEIGRNLVVSNGAGLSIVNLNSNVLIGGNLSVTSGTGQDTVTLIDVSIGGKLTATLGNGGSTVTLVSSLVHKSVLFQGGTNSDSLRVADQWIGGSLTAKLGGGLDEVELDTPIPPTSTTGSRIDGRLTLNMGAGQAVIEIGTEKPVIVGGAVTLITGDEDDFISFDDFIFLGTVFVDLRNGGDTLELDVTSTSEGVVSAVFGNMKVLGRGGDDVVTIGAGFADTRVSFAAQPVLNGGSGINTLSDVNFVIDGLVQALTKVSNFN